MLAQVASYVCVASYFWLPVIMIDSRETITVGCYKGECLFEQAKPGTTRRIGEATSKLWLMPSHGLIGESLAYARKKQLNANYVVIPLWPPILLLLIIFLLPMVASLYRRRKWLRSGSCTACGYSLTGLPKETCCPECGGMEPRILGRGKIPTRFWVAIIVTQAVLVAFHFWAYRQFPSHVIASY